MGITSRVVDFSPSARHEQVSVSSGQVLGGQGRQARHRTVLSVLSQESVLAP